VAGKGGTVQPSATREELGGMLGAGVGYFAGVFLGFAGTMLFSANNHDRGHEASFTGIFCCGPTFTVIGAFVGVVLASWQRTEDLE
jgi:hypothetical protein